MVWHTTARVPFSIARFEIRKRWNIGDGDERSGNMLGRALMFGLGGHITIHDVPDRLDRYYGDEIPFSYQVFLRIRPSLMSDHAMSDNGTKPHEK